MNRFTWLIWLKVFNAAVLHGANTRSAMSMKNAMRSPTTTWPALPGAISARLLVSASFLASSTTSQYQQLHL